MTKAEKAFFSSNAIKTDKENSLFVQIFKLVDKQTIYSEASIIKSLKISPSQMARTKNYLYETIIESIAQVNSGDEPAGELRQLLNQTDALFKKRLFNACEKKLVKALAIAQQAELFTYYAEISSKLLQIKEIQGDRKWYAKNSGKALQLESKNLQKLEHLHLLKLYKHERMFSLYSLYGNDEQLKLIHGNGNLLIKEITALEAASKSSKTARLNYYNYLCFIKYVFGHNKEAVAVSKKAIALFKNDIPFTQQNIRQYLHVINNFLLIGQSFLKPAEVNSMLGLLKKCAVDFEKVEYIRTNALARYHYFSLINFFNTKKWRGFDIALEQTCNWLDDHNGQLVDQFNYTKGIEFLISSGYFVLGNYKKSIDYSQSIINHKLLNYDYHVTRINFLISHFELQNYELLESIIRSLERHYKNEHPFKDIALSICRHLKKIVAADNQATKRKVFQALLSDLRTIKAQPDTAKQLSNFEHKSALFFEIWCESNIQNKSIIALF